MKVSHSDNEVKITETIYKIMSIFNIDRMPTSYEVRSLDDLKWLDPLISRNGGYIYWKDKLQLNHKLNRTKFYNLEEIIDKIKYVMESLNVNTMPSRNEIIQIIGNDSLHNKIVRTGGYQLWANKLNLELKDSETKTGWNYEKYAIELLENKNYKVQRMTTGYPFDLLINNNIRIDIKSGSAYLLKGSRCHTFGINKRYATCDLYLIFALSEQQKLERSFIIPANMLRVVTMSIGEISKYNKYINRWDLIDEYDKFYKELKTKI
jgi:hypothetical protein